MKAVNFTTEFFTHSTVPSRRLFLTPVIAAVLSSHRSHNFVGWKIRVLLSSTLSVEIKFQVDATEVFIADLIACPTCFGHHYAHHQELKSIIQWLLPVVFRAVVFKLLVCVELSVMCPVCRALI